MVDKKRLMQEGAVYTDGLVHMSPVVEPDEYQVHQWRERCMNGD